MGCIPSKDRLPKWKLDINCIGEGWGGVHRQLLLHKRLPMDGAVLVVS
jgi:hypothetical protein